MSKNQSLPGGLKASPVNLPKRSDLREEFDESGLGLSPDEVDRYWIDQKIRDGKSPPRPLPSEGAVLRFVQSNKGAIGYVSADVAEGSVRVVARIRGGSVVTP